MEFVTLDFETANGSRNSACEIGLTFVKDGQVLDTRSWLIKPVGHFDPFNIGIHGIWPDEVKNKPHFGELWAELLPLLENRLLVAHNASFDIGVLKETLSTYGLPHPTLQYVCSCAFSKRIWKGLTSYGLGPLCTHHNIPLRHHRAGADSRATAELSIKAFKHGGIISLQDFPAKLGISVGQLGDGVHIPSKARPEKKKKA